MKVERKYLRPGMKVFNAVSANTAEVMGSRENPKKILPARKNFVAVRRRGKKGKFLYADWKLTHLAIVSY